MDRRKMNLLSPTGKLTRKPYIIIIVTLLLTNISVSYLRSENSIVNFILLIFSSLVIVIYYFTILKRLRDIGWSKWCALLTCIPFFSYIVLLILASQESNTAIKEKKASFRWENCKNRILSSLRACFLFMYWIYVCIQFSAIYSGANLLFNNGTIAFILASLLSFIPLIGTGVGIYGAHVGWNMGWISCLLLFLAHYLLFGSVFLSVLFIDKILSRPKNHE
jgi:uncharacterized membrane protein YhaH (DUF805 family)